MAKGKLTSQSFRADAPNGGAGDTFANRPYKLKFNFTATIKFRSGSTVGPLNMEDGATFGLKQASRPNPTVTYQDVNVYNYRTKVATKMEYGTMQITFFDDSENLAHDVYSAYLKSISPVANMEGNQANTLYSGGSGPKNKSFNAISGAPSAGSIGPLPPTPNGYESSIIELITIKHWYMKGEAVESVSYEFLNPKVVNMTLDELDMTQSDVSTIMMNFVYDSVYIDTPEGNDADLAPDSMIEHLGRVDNKADEVFAEDTKTFDLSDLRARISDVKRLIERVRRLDTIPDISVLGAIGAVAKGINNIAEGKPAVDNLGI